MKDSEHSLVVAFGVKQYGNEENLRRTVREMQRWLTVEMHRDVRVVAFAFTSEGNTVGLNEEKTVGLMADELHVGY